jgi:hypothetical protein
MKPLLRIAALAALVASPSTILANSWNEEQASAWKFVSMAWERHADDGSWYQSMDPSFYGWTTGYPFPTDRVTHKRKSEVFGKEGKILFFRLDPLAIVVKNNTAILYYFAEIIEEDHKSIRKTSVQRCSNTLIRSEREWRILGWMCDTQ